MCQQEHLSYQLFAYERNLEHQPCLDVGCGDLCEAKSNALKADTNRFMFMVAKTLCANRTISHASVQPSHTHGQWKNTLEVNVQLVLHCSTHLFS